MELRVIRVRCATANGATLQRTNYHDETATHHLPRKHERIFGIAFIAVDTEENSLYLHIDRVSTLVGLYREQRIITVFE